MVHITNQDLANRLNLNDLQSKPRSKQIEYEEFLIKKNQLLLKHFSFFYDLQVMITIHHIDDNVEYQLLLGV